MIRHRKPVVAAVLFVVALAPAACSSDSSGGESDLESRIADEIDNRTGVSVTVTCSTQAEENPELLDCTAEGGGESESFMVETDGDDWRYADDLPRFAQ